jgi:hypothetical protein
MAGIEYEAFSLCKIPPSFTRRRAGTVRPGAALAHQLRQKGVEHIPELEHWAPSLVDDVQAHRPAPLVDIGMEDPGAEADTLWKQVSARERTERVRTRPAQARRGGEKGRPGLRAVASPAARHGRRGERNARRQLSMLSSQAWRGRGTRLCAEASPSGTGTPQEGGCRGRRHRLRREGDQTRMCTTNRPRP